MRILVSGGGTGGHIYPAISLVKHIKTKYPEAEFLYVGTERGLESKIVPKAQIPFKTIQIQGFRRSLSIENVKTAYLFIKSLSESKKIIKEFKPDIVIGTGGYVCAAVVYSAHKQGIPTIIHEQNSVPGVTNKFLAKYVDKIAICFPKAAAYFPAHKVELTGNPRGQEVVLAETQPALSQFKLDNDLPTVLIFGGSQGALRINEAVMEALPELLKRNYQVLYASGERYYATLEKKVSEQQLVLEDSNLSIVPYIDDMIGVLKNVELVVSRAGATSLAEITALGIPSLLIPSPNVTNDHQTKNATSLVEAGAALLIKDGELTGRSLVRVLDKIMLDDSFRENMAKASLAEGIPDSSDRLLEIIESLLA